MLERGLSKHDSRAWLTLFLVSHGPVTHCSWGIHASRVEKCWPLGGSAGFCPLVTIYNRATVISSNSRPRTALSCCAVSVVTGGRATTVSRASFAPNPRGSSCYRDGKDLLRKGLRLRLRFVTLSIEGTCSKVHRASSDGLNTGCCFLF